MPVSAAAAENSQQEHQRRLLLNPDNNTNYYHFREIDDDEDNIITILTDKDTNHHKNLEEDNNPKRPKKAPTWKEEYAKSIIYAGMDSIITCFSLISSISAGRLSSVDVLVLGFANLIADGISMGFGDFVSTSTEYDLSATERDATHWDVIHYPEAQQRQLIQRYQELGMNQHDATTVVNLFSKYKDILVDEKLRTQKLPSHQDQKPWKNGLITFFSFLIFGTAPLLSFIILIPLTKNNSIKFTSACILSLFALLLLGLARAKISAQSYVRSAMLTILTGVIAAGAAYAVGLTLRNVADIEEDANP